MNLLSIRFYILAIFISVTCSGYGYADIYRRTDEKRKVHYSDIKTDSGRTKRQNILQTDPMSWRLYLGRGANNILGILKRFTKEDNSKLRCIPPDANSALKEAVKHSKTLLAALQLFISAGGNGYCRIAVDYNDTKR